MVAHRINHKTNQMRVMDNLDSVSEDHLFEAIMGQNGATEVLNKHGITLIFGYAITATLHTVEVLIGTNDECNKQPVPFSQ